MPNLYVIKWNGKYLRKGNLSGASSHDWSPHPFLARCYRTPEAASHGASRLHAFREKATGKIMAFDEIHGKCWPGSMQFSEFFEDVPFPDLAIAEFSETKESDE
jgi:hypothetical protein